MQLRISVVIITYKQQELIKRALNSVLSQREYGLKEIIVSDDSSPDGTWDTIMEYSREFPEFIKAYRNEKNLGIYANLQRALTYVAETDLVLILSGDDEYCDGFFKNIINTVKERKININSCYSIFCDFQIINPKGQILVFKQDIISKYSNKKDLLSLKLRHLIYGRSNAISYAALKRFKYVPIDKGVSYAENYFDIQPYIYSDSFYYFPYVGSTYYSAIGVSTSMSNNINEYQVLKNVYHDMQSLPYLGRMDTFYLKYLEYKYEYLINSSLKSLFKALCFFLCGFKYPIILYRLLREKYFKLLHKFYERS